MTNRTRRMLVCGIFGLVLALVPADVRAQTASGHHMLWSVASEEGVEGFMIGSIHVMKPGVYPLDSVFGTAFDRSDVLVFEIDLDSMRAKGTRLLSAGMLQGDTTLAALLSADIYELTRATAEELGVPMARLERMEPWLVSITLPAIQYTRAGYAGTAGIDLHFYSKAKEAGKEVAALETVEFQIQLFDGMSRELQEALLHHSLLQADRTVEMIDRMMQYWKTGNAAALAAQMEEEWSSFPRFYNALVVERNLKWLPQIEELLAGGPLPLVVVGAGHIIGEDGLIRLLEDRGYTVEQL